MRLSKKQLNKMLNERNSEIRVKDFRKVRIGDEVTSYSIRDSQYTGIVQEKFREGSLDEIMEALTMKYNVVDYPSEMKILERLWAYTKDAVESYSPYMLLDSVIRDGSNTFINSCDYIIEREWVIVKSDGDYFIGEYGEFDYYVEE